MISQNQIQRPQLESKGPNKASFSPHVTKTFEMKGVPAWNAWDEGSATCSYSEKHNMILVCPACGNVQFYDADTLLPHRTRETLSVKESITQISFWPESDEYIMGCSGGSIYSYNASSQVLKTLRSGKDEKVLSIVWVNSQYYAFSLYESGQIHLGNFQQEGEFLKKNSRNFDAVCFENLPKRNILISGLLNGSVLIYRTDQLPRLPVICRIKAQKYEKKIESARIGNSEFIITYGSNGIIRVWNLTRRKMRLIRVIKITQTAILSGIYFEDYKVIAVVCLGFIKFINLITGKVISTVTVGMQATKILLMKDKNMLGVVHRQKNRIKMISLC